jgi:Tol biopolymer transport system component
MRAILVSFILLAPSVVVGAGASQSAPRYEIAFASFGPNNADLFLADSNGENDRPFLPHAGFDGNASFSSDGQRILFTSEREGSFDIYRSRVDGTALERLVDSPAYDDQAALCPDGKRLAFVSSRTGNAEVWILEMDTRQLRNVTHHPAGDFRPAWSPDGQWLAFSSDRDSRHPIGAGGFALKQSTEIYIVKADGTGLRRLTHAHEFAGSPTWSPDGQRLLYHESTIPELSNIVAVQPKRGTTQIAVLDLGTGERATLTTGAGEKLSPRWLASDRIGFTSGGSEGGLEFVVSGKASSAVRGEIRCPSWSADGQRMIFHREVEPTWPAFQRWHSADPQFGLFRTGVFPAYDPAGEMLVCSDQLGAINSKNLLTVKPDGTAKKIFFDPGEKSAIAAVWSPDGKRLAFAYGRFFQSLLGPAIADIAVVDRHGANLKVLTDGSGNVGFPSWSSDGTQIVYRASAAHNRGLFILDVANGKTRPLTPASSHDNFPAWAPTGDRIAFTRYRDGDYDIYTIKSDGTDPRRLTHSAGNDAHCAWSPDGEWIAFTTGRQGFKDEAALYPRNGQPYGEVAVMRADGSDVRVLTDNPFEEGTVAWAPLRE